MTTRLKERSQSASRAIGERSRELGHRFRSLSREPSEERKFVDGGHRAKREEEAAGAPVRRDDRGRSRERQHRKREQKAGARVLESAQVKITKLHLSRLIFGVLLAIKIIVPIY